MIEFTVQIVTYNDADRLLYVLNSLKDYKNVVVIDKSSTDNTKEVVESFNRPYYKIVYFDSQADKNGVEAIKKIQDKFPTEWVLDVTCSDILHPALHDEMLKYINENPEMKAVFIPLYRYSMGYVSKYSFYGDITYQRKLFKKSAYDFNIDRLHEDCLANANPSGYLKPSNKAVAFYHLTHENLEMVMERHLRYARVEAETDMARMERSEYLYKSWRSVLRVVKNYLRLRTYKLGDKGKAQLCMLLMYRCANYLNLYFSKEEENNIKQTYDKIRRGEF